MAKREIKKLIVSESKAEKFFDNSFEPIKAKCPHCREIAEIQPYKIWADESIPEEVKKKADEMMEEVDWPMQAVCSKCGNFLIVGSKARSYVGQKI